jgi:NADH-quinone oxidoreductase subunit G
LAAADRLTRPLARVKSEQYETSWDDALRQATARLKSFRGGQIALLASARLTNEELFVAKRLIDGLGIGVHDIVPRRGEADQFLRSADLNPNSAGAKLLGVSNDGAKLADLKHGVANGEIKALVVTQENALDAGLTAEELAKLELLIYVGLAPNETAKAAHFALPSAGFAEKRGSMINGAGRLQRLNQAHLPPGQALDDWEILRDLGGAGGDDLRSIEDVFAAMAAQVPPLAGLSLKKIGDLGVPLALTVNN